MTIDSTAARHHHPAHPPSPATGASATPRTMSAVVQRRYGPPSTLHLEDVPVPAPGPGEVLVRVRAASVNAKDWHIMRGEPRIARLNRAVFGARGPRVPTPGTDLAGAVAAVGDGVNRWAPGDMVVGEGTGAFAEYALARAEHLVAVPSGVSLDQAAALPLAASTASLCIDAAEPAPGRAILINGASGGVGTFAVQLAAQRQMHVSAVVSPRNVAQAERLGADTVIDYTAHDFTQHGRQYDAVLDLVGNRPLRDLRRLVRPGGALVLSGGGVPGTGRYLGPFPLLVQAAIARRRAAVRMLVPRAHPDATTLHRLLELVATRRLEPVIDRRFCLEDTAEAFDYVESTHASGKVIIDVP